MWYWTLVAVAVVNFAVGNPVVGAGCLVAAFTLAMLHEDKDEE